MIARLINVRDGSADGLNDRRGKNLNPIKSVVLGLYLCGSSVITSLVILHT